MSFAHNPYYAAFNMQQMPYSMPIWNNLYVQPMPYHVTNNVSDESMTNPVFQSLTPKKKVDIKSPKSSGGKSEKSRKKANKAGPKET